MCQCPEWGDLHFYGLNVEDKSNNEGCVNALKGATFISTDVIVNSLIMDEDVSMP